MTRDLKYSGGNLVGWSKNPPAAVFPRKQPPPTPGGTPPEPPPRAAVTAPVDAPSHAAPPPVAYDDASPEERYAAALAEIGAGKVQAASDALVAVGGSWGTLSEIAFALRTGKPVVGLRPWLTSPPAPATGPSVIEVAAREDVLPVLLTLVAASKPVSPGSRRSS